MGEKCCLEGRGIKPKRGMLAVWRSPSTESKTTVRGIHGSCGVGAGASKMVLVKFVTDAPVREPPQPLKGEL